MSITLWQSLSNRAQAMTKSVLQGITSQQDWQAARPARHQEFMQDMGLHPLPARCELRLAEHGTFSGAGYVAKRISFQMLEHCWSTGVIFYPDPKPSQRGPGVLYVCGHGKIGSHHYQPQAIAWARRGYVCLILDTIEQHENTGEHHGASLGRNELWMAMGYTSAGAEVWNAMRAMDVLSADPLVDPARIGITGVSGGGACSFHTACADERFAAVSTLAGISSPMDAITHRHLDEHCDCMYPLNLHGRDIADYAALIAPRAAQFCFLEQDSLYHVQENRDMVARAHPVWKFLNASERCRVVTTPGPHGNHPVLEEATHQWFDKHLAGEARPKVLVGPREHAEPVFSSFAGQAPQPNRLELLPQLIAQRGGVSFPENPAGWAATRQQALARLLDAAPSLRLGGTQGSLRFDNRWTPWAGLERVRHIGTIEQQDVQFTFSYRAATSPRVVISVAGPGELWQHANARAAAAVSTVDTWFAAFETRVSSYHSVLNLPREFPLGSEPYPIHTSMMRAMALVGTTPVAVMVQDLSVLMNYLQTIDELRNKAIYLMGSGASAAAVLYYALQDQRVAGVILEKLPSSHVDGAPVLGVLRALDIQEAVGLMAPRPVALVRQGHSFWNWPSLAYQRQGCPEKFLLAADMRSACEAVMK